MEPTPRELFKALKFIYATLTAGVAILIVAFVIVKLSEESAITDKNTIQYFWTISMLLTLSVIPATYYLFKKKISGISEEQTFIQKLIVYRSAFILKMAMLEACGFINIIFYQLTGNMYILYAAIIALIIMIINYPNKSTISSELKLTPEENELL
ncbi:MAG TPA: hypothetical protein PKK00_11460 [Bacteroidales bacterium]|nr:hypothetical protein [Bacteroidales bacterium]HPS17945.1 hypothetical protein [Bacteroidales bacterium]